MATLSQAVTLKVTRKEYAALRWNARQLGLKRYERRKPSAAAVLRTISLDEAVRRYEARPEAVSPLLQGSSTT